MYKIIIENKNSNVRTESSNSTLKLTFKNIKEFFDKIPSYLHSLNTVCIFDNSTNKYIVPNSNEFGFRFSMKNDDRYWTIEDINKTMFIKNKKI